MADDNIEIKAPAKALQSVPLLLALLLGSGGGISVYRFLGLGDPGPAVDVHKELKDMLTALDGRVSLIEHNVAAITIRASICTEDVNGLKNARTVEERDCQDYRNGINGKLVRLETLQERIIKALEKRGVEVGP